MSKLYTEMTDDERQLQNKLIRTEGDRNRYKLDAEFWHDSFQEELERRVGAENGLDEVRDLMEGVLDGSVTVRRGR